MSLLTHCGGRVVDVQELESIELPQTTRTYQPLPYTDFIDMVKEAGNKSLAGYDLANESYAVSKNNKKMFGVLTYEYSYRDSSAPDASGTLFWPTTNNLVPSGLKWIEVGPVSAVPPLNWKDED